MQCKYYVEELLINYFKIQKELSEVNKLQKTKAKVKNKLHENKKNNLLNKTKLDEKLEYYKKHLLERLKNIELQIEKEPQHFKEYFYKIAVELDDKDNLQILKQELIKKENYKKEHEIDITDFKLKKINLLTRLMTSKEELSDYYRKERKYKTENNIDIVTGIEKRKNNYKLFHKALKIDRIINGRKLEILKDERIDSKKPHIFAPAHFTRYDIEIGLEAINEQAYFMMGDPGETYKSIDYYLLNANGIVFCDLDYKEDRQIFKKTAIELLNKGQNIYMYPEGTWNMYPYMLVQPIFKGAVEMAKVTGADIIPIGMSKYGKKYIVNIGKNITVPKDADSEKYNEILRDAIATLNYEIIETKKINRSSLKSYEEEYQKYIEEIMKESNETYNLQRVYDTRFKDNKEYDYGYGPVDYSKIKIKTKKDK